MEYMTYYIGQYLFEYVEWYFKIEEMKDYCDEFAENGDLKMLIIARDRNYYWDHWTCAYAAYRGNLDILKWAHENGCEWNSQLYINAIYGNSIEVLKWAHENKCPYNKDILLFNCPFHNECYEYIKNYM